MSARGALPPSTERRAAQGARTGEPEQLDAALSANAFVDHRAACLEAGMGDHLAKPVEPVLPCSMLAQWLPMR